MRANDERPGASGLRRMKLPCAHATVYRVPLSVLKNNVRGALLVFMVCCLVSYRCTEVDAMCVHCEDSSHVGTMLYRLWPAYFC